MVKRVVGLDFGTTNSLISYVDGDGARVLDLTNLDDQRPHPSVVWYRGGGTVVGREARKHLDSGAEAVSGDFVRSPERLLAGSAPVFVAGREIVPSDVVAKVLEFLRGDAGGADRGRGAIDVDHAVFTIPVALDGLGRRQLRQAARTAGISVVQFVHEPLAALYGYLRSQPNYRQKISELEGKRLLVFDWGGGTLDLTVCVLHRGRLVQLRSRCDISVGGDVFDEALRNFVKDKHARQHGIDDLPVLEAEGSAVTLLSACEWAKIALSGVLDQDDDTPILVPSYLRSGPGRDLRVRLSKAELEKVVAPHVRRGLANISQLLLEVGLTTQDIALCLPTGGMVQMPMVREGLLQMFGPRAEKLENGDRIIAQGAAWIAYDGLQLTLAKPIELLQPDGSYGTVVDESFDLPTENTSVEVHQSLYYCVDPRDGFAHFQFARPTLIGQGARYSERLVYGTLTVKVDPNARPLVERLKAMIKIDSDYVVKVDVQSTGRQDRKSIEIYDLEFALALSVGQPTPSKANGDDDNIQIPSAANKGMKGSVALRSNVTPSADAWWAVPGDILTKYRPTAFSAAGIKQRQLEERYYYEPCATCGRPGFECQWEGCDHPICLGQGMKSRAAALETQKSQRDAPGL